MPLTTPTVCFCGMLITGFEAMHRAVDNPNQTGNLQRIMKKTIINSAHQKTDFIPTRQHIHEALHMSHERHDELIPENDR